MVGDTILIKDISINGNENLTNATELSETLTNKTINSLGIDASSRTIWVNGQPYGNAYVNIKNDKIEAPIGAEIFNDFEHNVASGKYSHSEGYITKATTDYSHAEGFDTTASGYNSHAEGAYSKSLGNYSHAEGHTTTASGGYSHAEGRNTTALGENSHTEGVFTQTGGTEAPEYSDNYNIGVFTHAEGNGTWAKGHSSHAEGKRNYALAPTSHAEGFNNVVEESGNNAHVEGSGNIAIGNSTHIEGLRNKEEEDGGELQANHIEGSDNISHSNFTHVEGKNNIANAESSHLEGLNNKVESTAIGSHGEGVSNIIKGYASHAEGYKTTTEGNYSHAEGNGTKAIGENSHAEGHLTQSHGTASHAGGYNTIANGNSSFAHGNSVIANNDNEVAFGRFNNSSDNSIFSIGIGTDNENRKNAVEINDTGEMTINSHLTTGGSVNAKSGIQTTTINASGTVTVGTADTPKDLNVNGNITNTGNITNGGILTTETLKVNHESYLKESVTIGTTEAPRRLIVNGNIESTGKITSDGLLTVNNESKLNGTTYINSKLYINGIGNYDETINGFSEDLATVLAVHEVTYEELQKLIENEKLIPGAIYRITNYVTTVNPNDTNLRSAYHYFDIIVRAKNKSTLYPEAHADYSTFDSETSKEYFKTCDIHKWKLWYDVNNNSKRYNWATEKGGVLVNLYISEQTAGKSFIELDKVHNASKVPIRENESVRIADSFTVLENSDGTTIGFEGEFDDNKKVLYEYNKPSFFTLSRTLKQIDNINTHEVIISLSSQSSNLEQMNINTSNEYKIYVSSDQKFISVYLVTSSWTNFNKYISIENFNSIIETTIEDTVNITLIDLGTITASILSIQKVDDISGRGVIYRMIDEFNNDIPYDFKNIQFTHPTDTSDKKYYYTFSYENESSTTDLSLSAGNNCYSNTIKPYIQNNSVQNINKILFIGGGCYGNTFGNNCYNNSFEKNCSNNVFDAECGHNSFMYNCCGNTFGVNCYKNIFGESCIGNSFGNYCGVAPTTTPDDNGNTIGFYSSYNSFGNHCYGNTINNYCNRNSFGNTCYNNKIYSGSSSNIFGNGCYNNILGAQDGDKKYGCKNNYFGSNCNNNNIGYSSMYNVFGNNCYGINFKVSCNDNSFGNNCNNIGFGYNCSSNSFGNMCSQIYFASALGNSNTCNHYRNNHFGDGCQNIALSNNVDANSDNQVQNYNFDQGLALTKASDTNVINATRNNSFMTRVQRRESDQKIIKL